MTDKIIVPDDNNDKLSFDKSNSESGETQPRSENPNEQGMNAYSKNDSAQREFDPIRDTAVFNENDSRLRRMLNNQSEENFGTMSLGDKQEVILLIRGMVERIVLVVGSGYQLGRFEVGAAAENEIDLTPYGAKDRGVSRIHAELRIIDGIVHITDLGSTNGTFVNTKHLKANVATPLRKGDELILGRLPVQILFR